MPDDADSPPRTDPYRDFRIRVRWDGLYVAGFSKVSGLTRADGTIVPRTGGDPATPPRMPGQTDYGQITLERGVTPVAYLNAHLPLPSFRERDRARARLEEMVTQIIVDRRRAGREGEDFLQTLMDARYRSGAGLTTDFLFHHFGH